MCLACRLYDVCSFWYVVVLGSVCRRFVVYMVCTFLVCRRLVASCLWCSGGYVVVLCSVSAFGWVDNDYAFGYVAVLRRPRSGYSRVTITCLVFVLSFLLVS